MSLSTLKNRRPMFGRLLHQAMEHLNVPLYRNGYALLASGVISAGLGLVYWLLAARFYPPEIVGLNSALIAAIMFLAGIAQLGLNSLLTYFIPRAGTRVDILIGLAYGVSTAVALLAGTLFLWGADHWAPELRSLTATWPMSAAFVIAVAAVTLFTLQDSVLIGFRQSLWVPVENTLVALAKVVLLIGMVSVWQHYGITAAWMVPTFLSLLPVNWFVLRRILPMHQRTAPKQTVGFTMSDIRSHMTGNYIGGLFFLASTTLLPVIVTQVLGAKATAYFYIPWMITTGLHLIPQSMATSFTVEATLDEAKQAEYYRNMVGQCFRLLLPLIAVVATGAPYILALFGADYAAEGTLLLRLLPLALVPNVFVAMYLSMARLQNRMGVVVVVQGLICLLMLGLSYLLMQWWGITGVGVAWFVAQATLAISLYSSKFSRAVRG